MSVRIKRLKTIVLIIFIILIVLGIMIQLDWFWRQIYPLKYKELIISNSRKYDLDPCLLAAVIRVESGFSADARSHKGAVGLMQVMPETGFWIAQKLNISDFSEEQLLDPALNIKFGAWYLADLSREFDNELITILAAYNAGRGKVNSWLKEWNAEYDDISALPYSETRDYIRKVLKNYKYYSRLYEFE